jgi:hypothetical protein
MCSSALAFVHFSKDEIHLLMGANRKLSGISGDCIHWGVPVYRYTLNSIHLSKQRRNPL